MIIKKPTPPIEISDNDVLKLDDLLKNINSDISVAMSFIRRTQGLTFNELQKKFTGINTDTLKRYMQQSYPSMRPIHIVAAFSWVMMVPMTSFYYGFRLKEYYRGMDDSAVEALVCIGQLPSTQFNTILKIISNLFNIETQKEFSEFKRKIIKKYGILDDYNDLFPSSQLDINRFAIDYYQSVAITAKKFREENNISINTISKVVGLSKYQYGVLEDIDNVQPLPVSVGFRAKLGFKLTSHVSFTSEMKEFPEFHKLRKVQHIRDSLIVEALRKLSKYQKRQVIKIILNLSKIYID